MMLRLVVLFAVAMTPVAATGQGAIIETLQELRDGAEPPEFRASLPAAVDLTKTIPSPRRQAETSTCVSWSVTYAAASQALRRSGRDASTTLSPAFTYNLVARDRYCRSGSSISKTLDLLRDVGALPIEEFVFDAGWCGRNPTDAERQRAAQYRIRRWSRFDAKNIDAVKAQLARNAPVIFAMRIGLKLRAHRGDTVLEADDNPIFGHAMLAVGYDDARKAFRIQNSWGQSWGDGGYGWFSYDFWRRSVPVGFVID